MKKVSAIIVCCLLAVALIALPVFAAQTATFTVKASKTTVDPGDTITVSVSTTQLTACGTFGVTVLYDVNKFEPVAESAKCLIPGLSGGDISVAGKVNFFFKALPAILGGTPYTGSGDAFQVQLKVKDTAVGSSVISMTAAHVEEDASAATATSTVTIKVNCDHVWGAWTDNGANHKRECTKGCGETETADHSFGDYSVTTEPGCDKAGEKTATCSTCGAVDKKTVEATGVHIFTGAWEKVDETSHKRTCTTCQDGTPEVETKSHRWGTWTVVTPADCKNNGEEKRVCADNCGAFQTQPIPATGQHGYQIWTKVDDEKHTAVCSGCGEFPKTENHTWDNGSVKTPAGCDKAGVMLYTCTATGCGATKEEPIEATGNHTFDAWTKVDDTNHKRTCATCQDGTPEVETKAHTWDNGSVKTPAGCDKAGVMLYTCTATGCGATKEEPIEATGNHTWGDWTKIDDTNHKHTCSTCQDGTPAEETEAHNPSADLHRDADNHWNVCYCGHKMNVTTHVYDETKWAYDDEGHFHACECGAEKAGTKVAHTEAAEGVVTKKPSKTEYGEKTFYCTECKAPVRTERIDKVTTPNTGDNTLVIPMVILAVLSACGLAVTVVARKRASR